MIQLKLKQVLVERIIGFVCLLLVLIGLSGCTDPYAPKVVSPVKSYPKASGKSVQENKLDYYQLGSGSEVIMVIATIHGNEWAGTPLVEKLTSYLQKNRYLLANKSVIIIPVANPDGLAAKTRYNANGIDLNRNFPAENRIDNEENGLAPLSEPESAALYDMIGQYRPVRILSIHQPLACIDYDGPGEKIANNMGFVCDLPVRKLGSRPGSLGSYVGLELGVPIITLELRPADHLMSPDELWNKYGKAMRAFVVYPQKLW